jgi:hypothetical protein
MLVRWREKPETRTDRAVGGLLKKIARNKACDFLKTRSTGAGTNWDIGSAGGRVDPCAIYADPLEREELEGLICEAYELLDNEQRHVWYVFATNYPASRKYTQLAVFAGMPRQPRRAARLLENARSGIVRYLKRKGYHLD